jgi:hypothetical protein
MCPFVRVTQGVLALFIIYTLPVGVCVLVVEGYRRVGDGVNVD